LAEPDRPSRLPAEFDAIAHLLAQVRIRLLSERAPIAKLSTMPTTEGEANNTNAAAPSGAVSGRD
jgi:hypothetical protein